MNLDFCLLYYFLNLEFSPYPLYSLAQDKKHVQDAFITTHTRTKRRREISKGVDVLVQRKNGSTAWVTLKDMKNSYHVHMA